jgi:hypothetical protein
MSANFVLAELLAERGHRAVAASALPDAPVRPDRAARRKAPQHQPQLPHRHATDIARMLAERARRPFARARTAEGDCMACHG